MGDVSLELHALPDEIADVLVPFAHEERAYFTIIRYPPFQASSCAIEGLYEALRLTEVTTLLVSFREIILRPETTMKAIWEQSPDLLKWEIGRIAANSLGESWISARSDDATVLKRWRKLLNSLRKVTKAGASAVDPRSGASRWYQAHRYSPRAKALQARGYEMLPLAGAVRWQFPD